MMAGMFDGCCMMTDMVISNEYDHSFDVTLYKCPEIHADKNFKFTHRLLNLHFYKYRIVLYYKRHRVCVYYFICF